MSRMHLKLDFPCKIPSEQEDAEDDYDPCPDAGLQDGDVWDSRAQIYCSSS